MQVAESKPIQTDLIVHYEPWSQRRGRKSGYRVEFCDEMIAYFEQGAQTILAVIANSNELENDNGIIKAKQKQEVRRLCGQIPTFERFAGSIGVIAETLGEWAKKHTEFGLAYKRCKDIHWDWFAQGLSSGAIPANAGIFLAKNMTNMTDDTTVNVRAVAIADTPPVELRERTPGELAKLKDAVALAEALGYRITISDVETAPAPHATATLL